MLSSTYTVRVKLIGDELRRHREGAGLTLVQAGDRIGLSKATLSRMENGERPQRCEDVAGLLAIYGITGEKRRQLLQLTREAENSGLWQRNCSYHQRVAALRTLESQAVRLINFECVVIPGLLQTVPYAQALIRSCGLINDEEVIGQQAAARIHRQAVLRKPRAPELLAVIVENALHNVVGDQTIMREQLVYLTEAARQPNINLRVIPASVGNHPGLDGPFMRLQLRDRRSVIVLENRTSNLFLEDDETLMTYNHVLVELLSVAFNNDESIALVRDLESRLAQEQLQQ